MPLTADVKAKVISDYRLHKQDSGSAEVQVAILSHRIKQLTEHFKMHKKDHHSRRGLLGMVARRRRLLNYLKRKGPDKYQGLISSLGIRR
jgi:small subunit ribosomal protein S15